MCITVKDNAYGLGIVRIDQKTGKIGDSIFINPDKVYLTASTMKIILLGLFYENCLSALHEKGKIKNKDKSLGGILGNTEGETDISYEILIDLMITVSDNTATNIIFDILKAKLGDLTTFVVNKFNVKNTKILDIREQSDATYIMGSGESTPKEFSQLLKYFLVESPYANQIKNIMSNQFIKGRGLRYLDKNNFTDTGNKTGQLDDMINDCGFIETEGEIFLYNIFMEVPKDSAYEYQVENQYYKEIGKIILNSFTALNKRALS